MIKMREIGEEKMYYDSITLRYINPIEMDYINITFPDGTKLTTKAIWNVDGIPYTNFKRKYYVNRYLLNIEMDINGSIFKLDISDYLDELQVEMCPPIVVIKDEDYVKNKDGVLVHKSKI